MRRSLFRPKQQTIKRGTESHPVFKMVKMKQEQLHSFNFEIADSMGAEQALILRYMARKMKSITEVIQGPQWCKTTINELAEEFRYIDPAAFVDHTRKLAHAGYIEIRDGEGKPDNPEILFWVVDRYFKAADSDLVSFDPDDAERFGLVEAVLIHDIEASLKQTLQKGRAMHAGCIMSLATMAGNFPWPKAKIKAALEHLKDEKRIIQPRHPWAMYTVIDDRMAELRRMALAENPPSDPQASREDPESDGVALLAESRPI